MSYLQLRITREKLGELVAKQKLDTQVDETQMDEYEVEEKSSGFFKKLFLFVLIPVMFIIAILLIIATFTNTNVFQTAKDLTGNIPFISSDEGKQSDNPAFNNEEIVTLQAEVQQKQAEIDQLNTEIVAAKDANQAMLAEQERLQYELEKLQQAQDETKKEFREILTTFEKMSAKKAAPILVEMNEAEALRILSNMKPDTLSEILTKMTPAQAANFTELLAEQ